MPCHASGTGRVMQRLARNSGSLFSFTSWAWGNFQALLKKWSCFFTQRNSQWLLFLTYDQSIPPRSHTVVAFPSKLSLHLEKGWSRWYLHWLVCKDSFIFPPNYRYYNNNKMLQIISLRKLMVKTKPHMIPFALQSGSCCTNFFLGKISDDYKHGAEQEFHGIYTWNIRLKMCSNRKQAKRDSLIEYLHIHPG